MNNKLPKIFKKDISKEHIHNTKTSYASDSKRITKNTNYDKLTVEEKIRKLFRSTKYVFNIGVIIKTSKKDYDTKIIGKVKNSIITYDNDIIPIVEIEDIIIKDQ